MCEEKVAKMLEQIITYYECLIAQGPTISDQKQVESYHRLIDDLYNINPENMASKKIGINKYYKLYEQISIEILIDDIKNNKDKYVGKYKTGLIEKLKKKIASLKTKTYIYCGEFMFKEYTSSILNTLKKYSLNKKQLETIVVNYLIKNGTEDEFKLKEEAVFKIAIDFYEQSESKEKFCKQNNISINLLNSILADFRKSRPEEQINTLINQHYQKYYPIFGQISYYIKNGINLNGDIIPFTILDYYSLTKINIDELESIYAEMITTNVEKFEGVSNFLRQKKYCMFNKDNIQDIKTNERVVTKEEILMLYNYLEEENIPQTTLAMSIIISRYARNQELLPLNSINNQLNKGENHEQSEIRK